MNFNHDLSQGDMPDKPRRPKRSLKRKLTAVKSAGGANRFYSFKADRAGTPAPDFFFPKPKFSHPTCKDHTNYGGYDAACIWCNLTIGELTKLEDV